MTVEHHPAEPLLAAFAAGTLDHGQHLAIATHLLACPQCRGFKRAMENVGGVMLADLPPAALSDRALPEVEARLSEPVASALPPAVPAVAETEIPGIPRYARRYQFGNWKWIAPSVHLRPIKLPHESDTRVFLLRSGPGTKMLRHAHTGIEMTCVLSGAFQQEGRRYGPGDFDLGDPMIEHQPVVEPGEGCVCLVAMQGDLRLKGFIGRIVQPFVHL